MALDVRDLLSAEVPGLPREDGTKDVQGEVERKWGDDSYTVDASTVVERAETREEHQDALVRLPVIYRTAVVLHDAEAMTVAEIADVQGVGLPAAKQRLRRGRMMLVDALAQGRERRDALRGVPMRCWDARSKVSDYLDDELLVSERVLVERHLRPVRPAHRCMPLWWGRALPWAPYGTPTPSSPCRWPMASRSCSPSPPQHTHHSEPNNQGDHADGQPAG